MSQITEDVSQESYALQDPLSPSVIVDKLRGEQESSLGLKSCLLEVK